MHVTAKMPAEKVFLGMFYTSRFYALLLSNKIEFY